MIKNLKVRECLFHGIIRSYAKSSMEVLDSILKTKCVLTHEDLIEKGICHERATTTTQGSNAVCVCFHPDNHQLREQFKNSCIELVNHPSAFDQFVVRPDSFNSKFFTKPNPTIIFSSNLIEQIPYRKTGGYPRLSDEIQMLSSIPLEYMVAIGYPENDIEQISAIRDLLTAHNYDVPIVHPKDGTIYDSGNQYVKKQ